MKPEMYIFAGLDVEGNASGGIRRNYLMFPLFYQ